MNHPAALSTDRPPEATTESRIGGKLDRKAPPLPSLEAMAPGEGAVPPRTPTEVMVMEVFRGVFKHTDLGVFDSFFDLGGHSIMAVRVMLQLREVSGRDLPLGVLFERPTVAALAEAIDAFAWLESSRRPLAAAGDRVEIEL